VYDDLGDAKIYKKNHKILILLRGSILIGEKPEIKSLGVESRIEYPNGGFPRFQEGKYENIYFELGDGEYLSPRIF
jgi:hypothetical protein